MNRHIFVVTIVLLYSTLALGTVDSRGCWTCSPGYAHWYDLGLPQPNDRCACVKVNSQTTTKAPTAAPSNSYDTRGCWTCNPGWTHWFNAGLASAPGGDRCACVPAGGSATTRAPAPAPTTTSPTAAPSNSYDTRGCWTCNPGWTHWFNAGLASAPGGDRCACVPAGGSATTRAPAPAPTTRAPTTSSPTGYDTRGCWTCNPGYTHWFNAGLSSAPGGDRCACVAAGGSSPSSPSSAPNPPAPAPTTRAPAPQPTAGTGYSGQMKRFIDAMTPNANSPGSISFSPGVAPYSPWNPPPLSIVGQLLDNLKAQTKFRTLMMYFIDYYTLNIVKDKGFRGLFIVDLTTGDNSNVINNAIAMAKQFPDTILALACGNELGANHGMTDRVVQVVNQCVSSLKAGGVQQPVGSIDVFSSWCGGRESPCNTQWSAISNNLDWIGLNDYPWWTNVFSGNWPCTPVSQAAQKTLTSYRAIQSLYPNKPIVMTEFGWPTAPVGTSTLNPSNVATGQQCGIANDANQKLMVQNTIDLFRANNLPCNTFQAFGESWKAQHYSFDAFWGICRGSAPYNCVNVPN